MRKQTAGTACLLILGLAAEAGQRAQPVVHMRRPGEGVVAIQRDRSATRGDHG
jgi:hypothetical protein